MLRLLIESLVAIEALLHRLPRAVRLSVEFIAVVGFAAGGYALAALAFVFVESLSLQAICPAAPTDIPAYACTVGDYVLRMTVGGFAFVAHLMLLSLCLAGMIALWIAAKFAMRFLNARR